MALLVTDPVCFRRDTNGDVKFPLELASGLEAFMIGVRSRLALFAGEMFSDLDAGVPYVERPGIDARTAILGQAYDPVKARAAIRAAIMRTPGALDVPTLVVSLDANDRKLGVTFVARTQWGDTDVETFEQVL